MTTPFTDTELRRHALRLGIHPEIIRMRLRSGWSAEEAINVGHERFMSTPPSVIARWQADPWETIKTLAAANGVPFKTAKARWYRGEDSICEICSRRKGIKKPSSIRGTAAGMPTVFSHKPRVTQSVT